MAASSKRVIIEAERRFPIRIRIAVPAGGFGERLNGMHAWLDLNCGAEGWLMLPAGLLGVVNDAVALYLVDATPAAAFVARWCRQHRPDLADGAFLVREDDPPQRAGAPAHKTP
jgi:hypothetical protein